LSYITETLLAEMEQTGVEVSSGSPFGADDDRTYHSCRIVDAVCYVAFQVDGVDAAKSPGKARIVWLEKPVQIDRAGYCPDGQERYAIRDLPMSAAWETGAVDRARSGDTSRRVMGPVPFAAPVPAQRAMPHAARWKASRACTHRADRLCVARAPIRCTTAAAPQEAPEARR
jgi:hypothetical protein